MITKIFPIAELFLCAPEMSMSVEYTISGNKNCRLCLRKTAAYIDLFEGKYQQMIFELTSLEVRNILTTKNLELHKPLLDIRK